MLDLDAVRSRFPALASEAAFFDGPGGSQVPQSVVDAVAGYLRESNANLGGAFPTSRASDDVLERARAAAADFTGGEPEGIAFGANMTTLNFQLAHAVARTLRPGDEIVVTALDHDANVSPWLVVAEDHDLVVRTAPLRAEDVTLDLDAPRGVDRRAHPRGGVHPGLERRRLDPRRRSHRRGRSRRRRPRMGGRRAPRAAPPAARGRARARRGALLAVQVLRAAPGDRRDPPGPGGVAAGRPRAARRRGPARASLRGRHPVARGDRGRAGGDRVPPGARRGRPRRGLRADRGARDQLAARFLSGLPDGVRLYGIRTPEGRTPTFCFNVDGRPPREVAELLGERELYVWDGDYYALEPMRALGLADSGGAVRAGFLHYTTEDEVDRLLEALSDLTPERPFAAAARRKPQGGGRMPRRPPGQPGGVLYWVERCGPSPSTPMMTPVAPLRAVRHTSARAACARNRAATGRATAAAGSRSRRRTAPGSAIAAASAWRPRGRLSSPPRSPGATSTSTSSAGRSRTSTRGSCARCGSTAGASTTT